MLPLGAAADLFDQVVQAVQAKRDNSLQQWICQAWKHAALHPPQILGREPRIIEATATASKPAPRTKIKPTQSEPAVLPDLLRLKLGDWEVSVAPDGSGTVGVNGCIQAFDSGFLNFEQVAKDLRIATLDPVLPLPDVPFLKEQLQFVIDRSTADPTSDMQNCLDLLTEFGAAAVRVSRSDEAVTIVNTGKKISFVVTANAARALFESAVEAIGGMTDRLATHFEKTPPDFSKAEKCGHRFSVKHPEALST